MMGEGDDAVGRLKSGEDTALAELFQQHRPRLRRIVEFRLDNRLAGRVDPSDILQETYIAAAQRLNFFLDEPSVPFFVWVREVAMQRLVECNRRHIGAQGRSVGREAIHSPVHRTGDSLVQHFVSDLTPPSQVAQKLELARKLRHAIDSMDELDREILALRHFEELTNDEVCSVLGIKKAAASNRYVRALRRLKQTLAQDADFDSKAGKP